MVLYHYPRFSICIVVMSCMAAIYFNEFDCLIEVCPVQLQVAIAELDPYGTYLASVVRSSL